MGVERLVQDPSPTDRPVATDGNASGAGHGVVVWSSGRGLLRAFRPQVWVVLQAVACDAVSSSSARRRSPTNPIANRSSRPTPDRKSHRTRQTRRAPRPRARRNPLRREATHPSGPHPLSHSTLETCVGLQFFSPRDLRAAGRRGSNATRMSRGAGRRSRSPRRQVHEAREDRQQFGTTCACRT